MDTSNKYCLLSLRMLSLMSHDLAALLKADEKDLVKRSSQRKGR